MILWFCDSDSYMALNPHTPYLVWAPCSGVVEQRRAAFPFLLEQSRSVKIFFSQITDAAFYAIPNSVIFLSLCFSLEQRVFWKSLWGEKCWSKCFLLSECCSVHFTITSLSSGHASHFLSVMHLSGHLVFKEDGLSPFCLKMDWYLSGLLFWQCSE